MSELISFSDRLSYYEISDERRKVLRQNQAQLMREVPRLLDLFYKYVTTHSVSKDKFAGKELEGLKKAQAEHWSTLFSGEFSEDYTRRSIEIGKIHERIGITPFLYIGGYNFILTRLTGTIIARKSNPSETQALISAVTCAVLMDMELALTSYGDASNATAANKFADNMLDKNVELSMSINEVSIENTNMLTSLESVNTQAQSIASAVEEMATGIATISKNGEEVAQLAESAQEETRKGKQVVQEAAANMNRVAGAVRMAAEKVQSLAAKSENIASMVDSIEKIASQTNLLALNATIEAARAGEAGKGFAVVAGEVKTLANQTAKATIDIRETIASLTADIDGIVLSMNEGAQAVTDCEASMQSTVNSIDTISEAIILTSERMADISNILAEQEDVSTEVSSNVSNIATSTQNNVEAINHSINATDGVVNLISEQIIALSEFDIPKKSIRIAKSDHIVWKKRLADMLIGRETLTPEELSSHHSCRLGKWYYGEQGIRRNASSAYIDLETPHKMVHDSGIEAVRLFNAGDRTGALEMLKKVEVASVDVIKHLDRLIAEE